MKPKFIVALILVLVGTNIFTYATARYWTTSYVLTRAQERTYMALRKEGLDYLIYPPEKYPAPKPNITVYMAIRQAGGMYFWWNDGIIYWIAGGSLTIIGLFIPFVEPRRKHVS